MIRRIFLQLVGMLPAAMLLKVEKSTSDELPIGTIVMGRHIRGLPSWRRGGWRLMDGRSNARPGSGIKMNFSKNRGRLVYFERVA